MEKPTVTAKLKNLPMSPQKVRLVVDMIRGKKVDEAITSLKFLNKTASLPVAKLILSAVANAEENKNWNRDELFISKVMVGDGIRRRWRRFVSRGRMRTIIRRYSNIDVELQQKEAKVAAKPKKAEKAKVTAKKSETKITKSKKA
jgi:large subunit ribosomal protein L22